MDPAQLRVDDGGVVWRSTWRAVYAVFRHADWFTRALVALRVPTYADAIVELGLVGRRTGLPRPVLVGLLRIDDRLYVGHPSGSTPWLANLAAADAVTLRARNRPQLRVHSTPLVLGLERDAAIRAAARQEPLPMRPIFWASRRHSLRAGVYHRLDVIVDPTAA